jgi:DNA polymerase-1
MFPAERQSAKACNFSIAYGMGEIGLADALQTTREEARSRLRRWYADKREVEAWKKRVVKEAREMKSTVSILGRRRTLPHIRHKKRKYSAQSERAGVNYCVQGSAADVVMLAMIRLHKDERLLALGFKLVLQVHDEIVLEGPAEHVAEATAIVKRTMEAPFEDGFSFAVPLVAEVSSGTTWEKAKAA